MAAAMGINVQVPAGTNPSQQQAYNEAMNAMAMQQAAAVAAAGQQFFQQNPFLPHPMMTWQPQHSSAAAPASQQ